MMGDFIKIKDKIQRWNITIEGIDEFGKTLIGCGRAITQELVDEGGFDIVNYEFKSAWHQIKEKSEEDLS